MYVKVKIIAPTSYDADLQTILDIRKLVFRDEQGIPEKEDDDGYDDQAYHALIYDRDEPVGVGRLVINDGIGVLARIAVKKEFRGKGHAANIVKSLERYGKGKGAQSFELYPHAYLKKFYTSLGYTVDQNYRNQVAGYALLRMFK